MPDKDLKKRTEITELNKIFIENEGQNTENFILKISTY